MYVDHLYEAFQNVNERYFFTETFRNRSFDERQIEDLKILQSTENSFSAELFHHWRKIMEKNPQMYDGLNLDFDLRKDWIKDNFFSRTTTSIRPDLVLHQSQLDWDPLQQKMYLEVKTSRNPFLINDLEKIIYSTEVLNFENAVFISVNSDYQYITELIKKVSKKLSNRLSTYSIDFGKMFLINATIHKGKKFNNKPIRFIDIINE